ncbi:hypothetical protein LCGC14_3157490 [marine sediment metagenome]|uniref:Uncharacterized protein n=1 Tax=marine sediment metagenome TaxID=412755 RepID=A0A0F8YGQ8_9ZZZZ
MATLRADRRLHVTADREQIVDEDDPRAAYLLAAKGRNIGEGDVAKYRLSMQNRRVVWPELLGKSVPAAVVKMAEEATDKSVDSEVAQWPLSMSPANYLERFGDDKKNSALARAVIEAEG